jgi:hypothetical protein
MFSVLGADETVGPDSPEWARGVADRARRLGRSGGLLQPKPDRRRLRHRPDQRPHGLGQRRVNKQGYYTDKSTKITYQDMPILAKSGTFYIIKGAARRRRGDLAPAGQRLGHVQPRAAAGPGHPPGGTPTKLGDHDQPT